MLRGRMARFRFWVKDHVPYIVLFTLIFLLLVALLFNRIFIIIKPGEAGILYRPFTTGTVTDYVYPEGLHIVNPVNSMSIYNARVQVIFHEFEVLTNMGLPITMLIAVRYAPIYELIGLLHQNVGPEYPQKIILPQIESVLRRNIGQFTPEDIYTDREDVLSNIITLALEEVGRKYVRVDELIIRSLTLPEPVRQAIENKLVYEQQFLAYQFRLEAEREEAERKRIEAAGIMVYQDIISATLNEQLIRWQGVQATLELAKSENAKVVVIGAGENGLPIILGSQ